MSEGEYKMIKVKMPFEHVQVNCTEPCKVKKGAPKLANYGLIRNSATVEISPTGSKKAMEYVRDAEMKKQEIFNDDGWMCESKRSFDDLMDAALNGGELSSEEQERLNTELPKRILTQYNNMQNLRLADDDERILEELKKHFLMKQQALKDMRQAAVDEAQQAKAAQQEAETAQDADEVANKAAEADMIAKSLEGLDQETAAGAPAYEEASGGSMSGMSGDTAVSGEEKAADHQRVLNYDTNNQDNIDEIEDRQFTEAQQERAYSKMLDESYERTMQVFENKESDLKERAETYRIFMDESRELAENREIARHLKIYDYESAVDLRLKALSSYGKKHTAAQSQKDGVQDTGRDFVQDAAADKLKTARKRPERNEDSETRTVTDDREQGKQVNGQIFE